MPQNVTGLELDLKQSSWTKTRIIVANRYRTVLTSVRMDLISGRRKTRKHLPRLELHWVTIKRTSLSMDLNRFPSNEAHKRLFTVTRKRKRELMRLTEMDVFHVYRNCKQIPSIQCATALQIICTRSKYLGKVRRAVNTKCIFWLDSSWIEFQNVLY